jgi:hypothetical protein
MSCSLSRVHLNGFCGSPTVKVYSFLKHSSIRYRCLLLGHMPGGRQATARVPVGSAPSSGPPADEGPVFP